MSSEDNSTITMKIKNEGDAHARLQGTAYIKSNDGEVVAETPLNAVVLDGGTRTYNVKLENVAQLDAGNYSIDFDLNNTFAPQNKFRSMAVDVNSVEYVAE